MDMEISYNTYYNELTVNISNAIIIPIDSRPRHNLLYIFMYVHNL